MGSRGECRCMYREIKMLSYPDKKQDSLSRPSRGRGKKEGPFFVAPAEKKKMPSSTSPREAAHMQAGKVAALSNQGGGTKSALTKRGNGTVDLCTR